DKVSKLYSDDFPNSFVGLSLSVPIFQGMKRIQATRLAELQLKRLEKSFQGIELQINSEYSNALATYVSSLNNYRVSKDNLKLAKEVYGTVQLQYRSGVKTYLDVVIAETDLRTSEVNTLDALFLVLSSKVDVQRASGTITY
ncbi:MAG: TolC family protein, partial [Sphingobacteriales bacterium]